MKTTVRQRFPANALLALLAAFALMGAEKGPQRQETQAFMRDKVVCAQLILGGLALEKYDVVAKSAVQLREMTQSNLWFTMKQPDYLAHTTNFQKSAEALYLAAIDRNLDASTEAYVTLAKSCVDCHRLVRLEQYKQQASGEVGSR